MCSVVGCDSWRRSAQRFKLPEDPESRLEWIQFIAEVNKQRFKESSWTDITVCSEHFKDDCFENLTPRHSNTTVKVQTTLKPSAVPSLSPQSDEPEPESPEHVEPHDQLDRDAQGSPIPSSISSSTDTSDAFITVYGQMHPENAAGDLIREKAALLQKKGKYVVNEKHLLQLFNCSCPSCGGELYMDKVINGVLIIIIQQCLRCEYRNQWKSQASPPTTENQQTQQAVPTDDTLSSNTGVPEIVAVVGEDSDPTDEEESSEPGDMDSDEDWEPENNFLLASSPHLNPCSSKVPKKETDNEDEDEDEEEEEEEEEGCDHPPFVPNQSSQLCTECGKFYSKRWRHTCEHKMKPYPCNFCGKRCVSEMALNTHSRIHDVNYEHRCKYCHATFKIKVDKHTHEQTHITEGKPYTCTDCSETFATNKERRLHLRDHRGPPQLKCRFCGIEFLWPLTLQRHLAVHTGERPFKCSVCQRGFNQAGHLKSHMRLHTGERPYKCQHCDKCFNHNVSLKSHVQRYHTPNFGCEKNTKKTSNTGDTLGNGNKRGADSELDNEEEEEDTEEDEIIFIPNKKRKGTGRPIGRPKRSSDNPVKGQCSNTKTGKPRERKKKRT